MTPMPPLAALFASEFFSPDALLARGRELVEFARQDPLAFTFWAVIWCGSFVTTFLFLRMLFTRWGDTHVTRKTLVLSLVAHFTMGLLSTRMVLSQPHPPRKEVVVRPVRQTRAEGEAAPDPQHSGDSPVWEQFAEPEPQSIARHSRDPQADETAPQRETPTDDGTSAVELPDLPVADAPPADPAPQRPDRSPVRPQQVAPPRIGEETATARAAEDLRATPQRTPRQESAGAGTPTRQPRPADTAPAQVDLPPALEGIGPTDAGAPAQVARSANTQRLRKNEAPAATPADPGAETADRQSQTAAGSPPSGGFSRVGRKPIEGGAGAPPERVRPGDSSDGGAEGAPRMLASGTGALGDPATGFAPEIQRSDRAGAIDKNSGQVPSPYRLRGLPQRKKFAIEMGATEESEKAVEASLKWLALHQDPRGFWRPLESTLGKEPSEERFNKADLAERQKSGEHAEAGLTALALLAFLGANYTQEDNLYADTVDRGLRWLVAQQDADGYLGGRANKYARMYCHGMATIALGEAYGMTHDSALREPLTRAVEYVLQQQSQTDGGWRYSKTQTGDVSMFGWQLMALRSAHTAGIRVPRDKVIRARDFLEAHAGEMKTRGLSRHGGLAAYRRDELPKPSMTAEALYCRQMLGKSRTDPAMGEAVDYLQQHLPRRSQQDLYYWYYGTLAMYHHGGEPWRKWNKAMRDNLVADQRTDGDLAGSWNPRHPWGDYGGRVFSTALSTLCLEVYYRFLPLYQMSSKGEDALLK
ncbi:MAG: hypothetical protein ACKV0T_22165 [Planctomycetales bacterium]